VLVVQPTSLNRGEGLVVGLLCAVEKLRGGEEGGWWWRNERDDPKSTMMRLM
jgi:hypothetical protein